MGEDLRIKMAYLLRYYQTHVKNAWMYLFGKVSNSFIYLRIMNMNIYFEYMSISVVINFFETTTYKTCQREEKAVNYIIC